MGVLIVKALVVSGSILRGPDFSKLHLSRHGVDGHVGCTRSEHPEVVVTVFIGTINVIIVVIL